MTRTQGFVAFFVLLILGFTTIAQYSKIYFYLHTLEVTAEKNKRHFLNYYNRWQSITEKIIRLFLTLLIIGAIEQKYLGSMIFYILDKFSGFLYDIGLKSSGLNLEPLRSAVQPYTLPLVGAFLLLLFWDSIAYHSVCRCERECEKLKRVYGGFVKYLDNNSHVQAVLRDFEVMRDTYRTFTCDFDDRGRYFCSRTRERLLGLIAYLTVIAYIESNLDCFTAFFVGISLTAYLAIVRRNEKNLRHFIEFQ